MRMGLFGEEIKSFKSAVTLFSKLNPSFSLFGLSNEVLCILVPQRVAKLPEIKVGDLKNTKTGIRATLE